MTDLDTAAIERPEPHTAAGQAMLDFLAEPVDYAWGNRCRDAIIAIEIEAEAAAPLRDALRLAIRTIEWTEGFVVRDEPNALATWHRGVDGPLDAARRALDEVEG
jgi:hypothetical protein